MIDHGIALTTACDMSVGQHMSCAWETLHVSIAQILRDFFPMMCFFDIGAHGLHTFPKALAFKQRVCF